MPADCLFCAIASGAVAASIVLETPDALAFLDHRPLFPGHCLLIPRTHYDNMLDFPASALGSLFAQARTLAVAMEDALAAEGTFVAVNNRVSQSVPHLHVHIVPRRRKDGLKGFFWPRGKYRDESEMEAVRAALRTAVERLRPES
ncbi:MAG: HIT family protein [Acidobacteriia bacterium]|nr:HIT family protein [Terriglobia bacterium]